MCTDPDLLKIVLLFKNIIYIIKIVAPLILIITVMIDMAKSVTADKENKIMESFHRIPKKLIAAALIFLVPTIVDISLNLIDENTNNEYATCITNANEDRISELYLEKAEELVSKAENSKSSVAIYDAINAIGKIEGEENKDLKNALTNRINAVKPKKSTNSSNSGNGSSGESGSSTLSSSDFPNYNQCDSRWSTMKINGKSYNTCNCGCGVTALASIASGLNKDSSITPKTVAEFINGYSSISCAYGLTDLTHGNITNKYNIKPKKLFEGDTKSTTEKKALIVSELEANHPIILLVPGHYIVLTDIKNGKINSYNLGRKSYDGKYTIDELYDIYSDYKSRCTNPEPGKKKSCGFRAAISYEAI